MNRLAIYIASAILLHTATCNGLPSTCYNCDGDACLAQTTNLHKVACPHNCCYASISKGNEGLVYIRGCVDEEVECYKFCAHHRVAMMFSGKDVLHCRSCDWSVCNNDGLTLIIKCYQCADCHVVSDLKDIIECTGGCYIDDRNGTVVRGCSDICSSDACMACYSDRCNSEEYGDVEIEDRKIKKLMVTDDWDVASIKEDDRKINLGIGDGVNKKYSHIDDSELKIGNDDEEKEIIGNYGRTIAQGTPTEIMCWECRHCNQINNTVEKTKVKCKSSACCYEAVVNDEPGEYLFTVRGCNTEDKCEDPCTLFKDKHMKEHPKGKIDFCIPCIDEGDDCNKNDYKLEVAPEFDNIKCYVCQGCNSIAEIKQWDDCDAACCYAAVTTTGVNRGCYELKNGEICENTCDYVTGASSCLVCKDEVDYCNDMDYFPVEARPIVDTKDHSIRCYTCPTVSTDCNVVKAETNWIKCPATCCYMLVIAGIGTENQGTERNCHSPSGTEGCGNICTKLLAEKKADFCMSCQKGEGDYCNDIEYHQKKLKINCYSCNNCNVVNASTPTIPCPRSDCCYKYISKKGDTDFAVRGCGGEDGNKCNETCQNLKKKDETLQFCLTCNEEDTDLCNQNDYHPEYLGKPEFILCYNCTNCNRVYRSTPVVKCKDASCCYKAIFKDHKYDSMYTSRGCVTEGDCEKSCEYIKKRHLQTFPDGSLSVCMTCHRLELDRCNGNDYNVIRKISNTPVECYYCWHCNDVEEDTPWMMCERPGCCYSALIRNAEHEESFVIRGCADIKKCELTCEWIRGRYITEECVVCGPHGPDLCNRKYDHLPKLQLGEKNEGAKKRHYLKVAVEPIKCFACHHCNVVDSATSTEHCPAGCCYHSSVRDVVGTAGYALRGCAIIEPDETCLDACTAAKRNYLSDHPEGVMKFCMPCDDGGMDGCNSNDYDDEGQSEMMCYACRGCTVVSKTTNLVKCAGACYTATDLNGLVIRGCVNVRTCEVAEEEYAEKHPGISFETCTVCSQDRCNELDNEAQPLVEYLKRASGSTPAECYQCEHCNKINSKTHKVPCSSYKCCYKAGVRDHRFDTVYAKRGCVKNELNTDDDCNNPCDIVKWKFKLKHPDGSVAFCTSCNKERKGAICNSNQYHPMQIEDPRGVQCYTCDNCNYVSSKTETVFCKWPSCCYHVVVNKKASGALFSVRGCYVLKDSQSCYDTCLYLRDIWLDRYSDGTFKFCLTCNEFDNTLCNRNNYHPMKTTPLRLIPKPLVVQCYSCRNCHKATAMYKMHCPDSACCYKAIVKDHEGDSYFPIRGCYDIEMHQSCHLTCDYVRRDHLEEYGDGEVYSCDTCKGERDFCNGNDYSFQKNSFLTPTTCYNCTYCDVITPDTPVVVCPIRTCCYTIVLRIYEDGDLYTKRGCANLARGEVCLDACKHMTRHHLEKYSEGGEVSLCMTCNEDDADRCNKNDYNRMHGVVDVNAMKCYNCRYCNKVTKYTPTVLCRSADCCYYALVYDVANQPAFVVRGCTLLEPGESCDHACLLVRRSHIIKNARGGFNYCIACMRGETDGCNNQDYGAAVTTIVPPIICYECRECNHVSKLTHTVTCSRSDCCYNAVVRERADGPDYVIRGCKLLSYSETCDDTCRLVHLEEVEKFPNGEFIYCLTCSSTGRHKCNRNDFNLQPPHAAVSKSRFIKCYSCDHDNCEVSDDTMETVVCSEPECCIRAKVMQRDTDPVTVFRGCVTLRYEHKCADSCPIFINKYKQDHPEGNVMLCMNCHKYDGDLCNRHNFHGSKVKVKSPFMECYACKDDNCATITGETNITKCENSCCFSAVLQEREGTEETEFKLERGCAKLNGVQCHRFCATYKKQHEELHKQNLMVDCELCDTNKCNHRKINLKPHFPLPDIPKWQADADPIHCYSCTDKGCYKDLKDEYLKSCDDKCCYTFISTNNTKNSQNIAEIERGCLNIPNNMYKCEDYCFNKKKEFESFKKNIVHHCHVCGTDHCNNRSYHKTQKYSPDKRRRRRLVNPEVYCYQCRDCETVEDQKFVMPCPSGCCYSTMVRMGTGEYLTERRCAVEAELPCQKSCRVARIEHHLLYPTGTLFDCVMCRTDLCNKRAMTTTPAMLPIEALAECYKCVGCYSVFSNTPKEQCLQGCCVTFVWTEFSGTNIARLCLQKDSCSVPKCPPSLLSDLTGSDSQDKIHYCKTCGGNLCNDEPQIKPEIEKTNCYYCNNVDGCDESPRNTYEVYCPTNCCFVAFIQRYEEQFTIRDCAPILGPNRDCYGYCNQYNESIITQSQGTNLARCESCSSNLCNSQRLLPKITTPAPVQVKCYECIGCYEVHNDTTRERCANECCYAKIVSGPLGTKLVRGCAASLATGQICDDYCPDTEQPVPSNQGDITLNCQTCTDTHCNAWKMHRAINCYECDGCADIDEEKTPRKTCASNCCYSAILKYKDGHYSNIRRCADYDLNYHCTDTAENQCTKAFKYYETKNTHETEDARKVEELINCEACSMENCNNRTLHIPRFISKGIEFRCHKCVGCYNIDNSTEKPICTNKCCYTTVWESKKGTNIVRHCADKLGITSCDKEAICNKLFNGIKTTNAIQHECSVCETNLCNTWKLARYYIYIQGYSSASRSLSSCTLDKTTDKHDTCYSNCLYSTRIAYQDPADECERGCVNQSVHYDCNRFCLEYSKQLLLKDPPIYLTNCEVCSENNCNEHFIEERPIPTPTITSSRLVSCYHCTDCYTVSETTPTKHCPNKCCYQGMGIRKCIYSQPCEEVKTNEYSETCTSDKCNNKYMNVGGYPSITCYSNVDCYKVSEFQCNKTIECPDRCCATSLWTEFQGTNIVRKCVQLNGTLCSDYCEHHVTRDLQTLDPQSILHDCRVCMEGDNCNDWKYPRSTEVVTTEEVMSCYSCVGCYSVTTGGDSATPLVECPSRCCLTARWIEFEGENIVRQCVSNLYEMSCEGYCRYYGILVKELDYNGMLTNCTSCEENACNGATVGRERKREQRARKNTPPRTPYAAANTHSPNNENMKETNFNCYDCYACNNVVPDTISVPCPSKCCYEVLWTELGVAHVARRCAVLLKENNCTKENLEKLTLSKVWLNDLNGFVDYLRVCMEANCNSEEITIAKVNTMSCYTCHNCDKITEGVTTTKSCLSRCCYQAKWRTREGEIATRRDCANTTLARPCGAYCDCMKKLKNRPNLECHTCNTRNCNNITMKVEDTDLSDSMKCFDCLGCDETSTFKTPTTSCSSKCCYYALWTNGTNEKHVVRRCARLFGENCDNVCLNMVEVINSVGLRGMMHECKACSDNLCNSGPLPSETTTAPQAQIKPAKFECYSCKNCSTIPDDSILMVCHSHCCYSIFGHGNDGKNVWNRDCVDTNIIVPGRPCLLPKFHMFLQEFFGETFLIKESEICATSKCNKKQLHLRRKRELFGCYDCIGCGMVENSTAVSDCSNGCCYSVVWTEFGVTNSARMCAEVAGASCALFCEAVRMKLGTDGMIHYCKVCTGDRCNNEVLDAMKGITCFNANMERVLCGSRCCYTVVRRVKGLVRVERSCGRVVPGRPCWRLCEYLRRDNGVISCTVCSSDGCNEEKGLVLDGTRCYHCNNCYRVADGIGLRRCDDNCCYTALWEEGGVVQMGRLCARLNGTTCEEFCGVVTRKTRGVIRCKTCSGDRCNDWLMDKPKLAVTGGINCYKCRGCEFVNSSTVLVECGSQCCYAAVFQGGKGVYSERGCGRLEPGVDCNGICNGLDGNNVKFCTVCVLDRCNIQALKLPIEDTAPGLPDALRFELPIKGHQLAFPAVRTEIRRKSVDFFECYDCLGCYMVSDRTTTAQCPDDCCYTILWTEYGVTSLARLCANLDGDDCHNYCNVIRELIKINDPIGVVHYCKSCSTSKCNHLTPPDNVVKPAFYCYDCNDCNDITAYTPMTICSEECCTSTLLQHDDGRLRTERKCARGITCYKACAVLTSRATIKDCEVCTESNCNIKRFPDIISYKCYTCIGCTSIKHDSQVGLCPDNCCYTMVWTESGKTNTARSCAKLLGTPCNQYCDHLKQTTKGLNYCRTCPIEKCNKDVPKYPKFKCYHCDDCANTKITIRVKKCNTNCCYTIVWTADGKTRSEKSCSTIHPCENFCNHLRKTIAERDIFAIVHYCKSCSAPRCNTEDVTTQVDHIFGCYQCHDCNSVNASTIVAPCPTACCSTVNIVVLGVETVVRRCEEVCETACGHAKENVKRFDRDGKLKYCNVCKTDRCNHETPKPVTICYKCHNCYSIAGGSDTQSCPTNCCSTINIQLLGYKVVARRCEAFVACQKFCDMIREDVKRYDPKSKTIHCSTCNSSRCNRQDIPLSEPAPHIKDTPIKCYQCNNCHTVTPSMALACPSQCCSTIETTILNSPMVTRRCETGVDCDDVCDNNADDVKLFDPRANVTFCKVCREDRCNNKNFKLKPAPITSTNVRTCYRCRNCYTITQQDAVPENCPTQCCSTIELHLLDSDFLIRRCEKKTACSNVCKTIYDDLKLFDRNSYIGTCKVCNTTNCNNWELTPPRNMIDPQSPQNQNMIECYKCRNCNQVDGEICHGRYCVTITARLFETELVLRRCLDESTGFCDRMTKIADRFDPNGGITLCKICEHNRCNGETVGKAYPTLSPTHISCYNCRDCSTVNRYQLKPCPTGCCSTIQMTMNGATVTTRSCELNCDNFCNKTRSDVGLFDTHGYVSHCQVCRTDGCNNEIVTTQKSVMCYRCNNCYAITPITPTDPCDSGCCSTIHVTLAESQVVIRRCEHKAVCSTVCKTAEDDLKIFGPKANLADCKVCNEIHCNNQELYPKTTTPSFECYKCSHCPFVQPNTQKDSCETRCCSTIQINLLTRNLTARGCERRIPCKNFCSEASAIIQRFEPHGKLAQCKVCSTNNCNRLELKPPPKTQTADFTCYRCYNCTTIDFQTPVESCPTQCCTSIETIILQQYIQYRRCERITPCKEFCDKAAQVIKRFDHTNGVLISCKVCNSNNCNTESDQPAIPAISTGYISCYTCNDCTEVTGNTPLTPCESKCCISALWISDGYLNNSRVCANTEHIPCHKYCDNLEEHHEVRYCAECTSTGCNTQTLEIIDSNCSTSADFPLTPPPMRCYKCYDCPAVSNDDVVSPCQAECCSTIEMVMHGVKLVSRACEFKVRCSDVCQLARKQILRLDPNGMITYCSVCSIDGCNRMRFHYVHFPNSTKHIEVSLLLVLLNLSLLLVLYLIKC